MTTEDFLERAESELRRIVAEDKALMAQEEGVRRKRAEFAEQIRRLRDSVTTYRDLMGIAEDPKPNNSLFAPPVQIGTIAEMAARYASERGGTVKIADVTKWLEHVGKLTHGGGGESARGNYGTVYGTLSRDRRFKKVGEGEFALVDEQVSVMTADGSFSHQRPDGNWENADGTVTPSPGPSSAD